MAGTPGVRAAVEGDDYLDQACLDGADHAPNAGQPADGLLHRLGYREFQLRGSAAGALDEELQGGQGQVWD